MMIVRHAPSQRRSGLTLMELVVVLTILVALAAILVPLFPNLLRRTHKATDATQTSEVAKAVQLHQATYLAYPNQFDLMTDGATTTAPDYLPADGGAFGGGAQIGTLTTGEVAALGRVGITSGHTFTPTVVGAPAGFQATQNPYAGLVTAPTALVGGAGGTTVFIIDATTTGGYPIEIRNIIARDATARFVVFGVGNRSSLVGTVMQNAPTSVPQNSGFTPATLYSRVGVIFQVSGVGVSSGPSQSERARFIAAAALEDDEIESTEKDIVGYYDVVRAGQ